MAYGQTVGKMAVAIKVVRDDGTHIEYADAAAPNIQQIISFILFFILHRSAPSLYTSVMKQRLGVIALQAPLSYGLRLSRFCFMRRFVKHDPEDII
ncbi:MAG: RDD family protein [Halobacteriota archaeon]